MSRLVSAWKAGERNGQVSTSRLCLTIRNRPLTEDDGMDGSRHCESNHHSRPKDAVVVAPRAGLDSKALPGRLLVAVLEARGVEVLELFDESVEFVRVLARERGVDSVVRDAMGRVKTHGEALLGDAIVAVESRVRE